MSVSLQSCLSLLVEGKIVGGGEKGLTLPRRFCIFSSTLLHLEGTACQRLQTW